MFPTLSPVAIAVATQKGGVGKTTTSMALSAALARAGDPVLLVDLDPQGHSTIGLGLDVDDDQVRARTVREVLSDDPLPLRAVEHKTGVPGLSIVPATIRLERVAQWLYGAPARDRRLKGALAAASGRYRWVVLDCLPSLGPLVENALMAADAVVLPCKMEARATDGARDLLEVLQILRPGFTDWRLLRNARDSRRAIANATADALFAPYADRLLETVIPQCEDLNHAQFQGVDIFSYASQSTGALAYRQLAEEVKRLWGGDVDDEGSER
jgi:chromosome partitioning protein